MIDASEHLELADWCAWRFLKHRAHLRNWWRDVQAEAYLGLVEATQKFDPSRCAFSTAAVRKISTRLRRMFDRRSMAQEWEPLPNVWLAGSERALSDYWLDIEALIDKVLARTPVRYRQVLEVCMRTHSYDEAAKALGITRERVRQIEIRAVGAAQDRFSPIASEAHEILADGDQL